MVRSTLHGSIFSLITIHEYKKYITKGSSPELFGCSAL